MGMLLKCNKHGMYILFVTIRLDQSNLWNSLYSNMGEAAIRFDWEQCKTSEKICTALEVSWKNIVVRMM